MSVIRRMLEFGPALLVAASAVVPVVEAIFGAGRGPEKRAEAIRRIVALLDPRLPDWLNPVVEACAGLVIDWIVAEFNRRGFFESSASGSNG